MRFRRIADSSSGFFLKVAGTENGRAPSHAGICLPSSLGCSGPTAHRQDPTEQLSGCVFSCHMVVFCFCGLIIGKQAVNNGCYQTKNKKQKIHVGEDMKKLEPSCSIGGIVDGAATVELSMDPP